MSLLPVVSVLRVGFVRTRAHSQSLLFSLQSLMTTLLLSCVMIQISARTCDNAGCDQGCYCVNNYCTTGSLKPGYMSNYGGFQACTGSQVSYQGPIGSCSPGTDACGADGHEYNCVNWGKCYDCPVNSVTASNHSACISCPAGRAGGQGADFTSCLPCPVNYYSNAGGSCTYCSPGSDTRGTNGSTSCEKCEAHHFSSGNGTSCAPCAAGTQQPTAGSSSCVACLSATSSLNDSSIWSFGEWSASGTACQPCATNQFSTLPPSDRCCTYGEISQLNCAACPATQYCPVPPSNLSTSCPAGNECPEHSFAPSPCQPGTYSGPSAAKCTSCVLGDSCAESGLVATQDCAAGFYCISPADGPVACASGTWSQQTRCTSVECCQLCPPGTFANSINSTACGGCEEPAYTPDPGSSQCLTCQDGSFWVSPFRCDQCASAGCDGSSECRIGYTGNLCASCFPGYYHPQSSYEFVECLQCGSTAPWVPPVLALMFVAVVALVSKINSSIVFRELTIPVGIGISYLQVVAYLRIARLQWPQTTRDGLSITSTFIADLRGLWVTECVVSWETLHWTIIASPILLLAILCLAGILFRVVYAKAHKMESASVQPNVEAAITQKHEPTKPATGSSISLPSTIPRDSFASNSRLSKFFSADIQLVPLNPRASWIFRIILRAYAAFDATTPAECNLLVIQSTLSFLSIAYLFLSSELLSIFDVIDVRDGHRVRNDMSLKVGSSSYDNMYLPVTVIGLIVYTIGIPVLMARIAYHRLGAFFLTTQVSTLTPSCVWWFPVQLVWKLIMAMFLQLLGFYPTAQVCICSALLALRCIVVFRSQPYLSHLHNTEEIALAQCTGILALCGLIFYFVSDEASSSAIWLLTIVVFLCLAAMVSIVVWSIVQTLRITLKEIAEQQAAVKEDGDAAGVKYEPHVQIELTSVGAAQSQDQLPTTSDFDSSDGKVSGSLKPDSEDHLSTDANASTTDVVLPSSSLASDEMDSESDVVESRLAATSVATNSAPSFAIGSPSNNRVSFASIRSPQLGNPLSFNPRLMTLAAQSAWLSNEVQNF